MPGSVAIMLSAECDGCGEIRTGLSDSAIPGYDGMVSFKGDDGYMAQAEWYACGKTCIPAAVVNRLNEVIAP